MGTFQNIFKLSCAGHKYSRLLQIGGEKPLEMNLLKGVFTQICVFRISRYNRQKFKGWGDQRSLPHEGWLACSSLINRNRWVIYTEEVNTKWNDVVDGNWKSHDHFKRKRNKLLRCVAGNLRKNFSTERVKNAVLVMMATLGFHFCKDECKGKIVNT